MVLSRMCFPADCRILSPIALFQPISAETYREGYTRHGCFVSATPHSISIKSASLRLRFTSKLHGVIVINWLSVRCICLLILMYYTHSAADDYTEAAALNRAVRVLCWVMTTPENHMSKAIHIQATWGRRCTKLLFVTEMDDTGALSVVRVDVQTGREHLTAKSMFAFQHIYDHHFNDADWFMKVSKKVLFETQRREVL